MGSVSSKKKKGISKSNGNIDDEKISDSQIDLYTGKLEKKFKRVRTKRPKKKIIQDYKSNGDKAEVKIEIRSKGKGVDSDNESEKDVEPELKSLLNDIHFTAMNSILDTYVEGAIKQMFRGPLSDQRIAEIRKMNGLDNAFSVENKPIKEKVTTLKAEISTKDVPLDGEEEKEKEKDTKENTETKPTTQNIKECHTEEFDDIYGEPKVISSTLTDFSGFFISGWIACFFFVLKNLYVFYSNHGLDLTKSEILQYMSSDLLKVAFCDGLMYLSSYFVFIVQWLVYKNKIDWYSCGRYYVYAFEFIFVIGFMLFAKFVMKFHWIAKIFIFLHSIVFLMKMHSYTVYNSYLWSMRHEIKTSKKYLQVLKDTGNGDKGENYAFNKKVLEKSIKYCENELNSQSPNENDVKFPENLTFENYFQYSMYPVLVYQINYPRNKKVRISYVLEKICAIFGIIFVMMTVAQIFMYPAALKAISLEGQPNSLEKWGHWAFACIDMIPGFICMYMLVWYLIWDAILNCIAELSRFGDRNFYGDWWNSVSWNDYSKHWNIPVHQFLLRHVYHASMSFWNFNKIQSVLFTFILSSIIHEMAMYVLFDKFRYYIFFFQMLQLPLTWLHYTIFKAHPIIGNCFFWFSICCGPTIVCCLYLSF